MHPEIENLIKMALADGQVTDKEREIILRKAEKLGLDVDEVEMYLEGKIGSVNSIIITKNDNLLNEVCIGNQIWMTKNLNVDKFRNGDAIPYAKYELDWIEAQKNKKPVYGYYDNNPNNEFKYGKIYNWYAVNDNRGLAPDGWKIPTIQEWEILINFTGGDEIAGEKMKSTSENWKDFGFGDDSIGFNAEPGGYCRFLKVIVYPTWNVEFSHIGEIATFFSSSYEFEKSKYDSEEHLWYRNFVCFNSTRSIVLGYSPESECRYIRCLKT